MRFAGFPGLGCCLCLPFNGWICWSAGGCGCPCIFSPAETFSLLFLLHPDTFCVIFTLILTIHGPTLSSGVKWAHFTTIKNQQGKHCRLGKQLSRGCARQRHRGKQDLPAEIEIQLPFKLFLICADFPNQLQAIFSPLQGVLAPCPG